MVEVPKFIAYSLPEEDVKVNVILRNESVWITQKSMADLFGVNISNVSKHIENIYSEGELSRDSTFSKMEIVQSEGGRSVRRSVNCYNLDMIISVGYRVNSRRATNFRIWATKVLKEYMIKGFALDDERLKRGEELFDKDYFDELLERIRSIRASERRVWQKITDIFAECSIDYDKDSPTTREFYAMVQNKFHYAITGKTAAEIVYSSADHVSDHMGLRTWKNAPDGAIRRSDVTVAKNYLTEVQIRQLDRTVSGFFDYIEDLTERGIAFTMEDFSRSVNEFLEFRRYDVLEGKGTISRDAAEAKAVSEYNEYRKTQDYLSDFDKEVRRLTDRKDDRGGSAGVRLRLTSCKSF